MINSAVNDKWAADEKLHNGWQIGRGWKLAQQFQQPCPLLQSFYSSYFAQKWSKRSVVCCIVLKRFKSLFRNVSFHLNAFFWCLIILSSWVNLPYNWRRLHFYDAIQWRDIFQCMHFITSIYYTILFYYIIKIYA